METENVLCEVAIEVSNIVGFTLSQATKALRESRGIALLYF